MTKLVVISGLPGVGKSTISEALASKLHCAILSVDPIEAAMRWAGLATESTGIAAYDAAATLAAEQLKLGNPVIVDAVNPIEPPRAMWRNLVKKYDTKLILIEVICSDEAIHKTRIEKRVRGIEGMPEITWERVQERKAEYQPWQQDRLVLDSIKDEAKLIQEALIYCR